MDETTRAEMTVNGFQFGNKSDVELAGQELSTVKYLDKKLENRNSDTILSVYQGVLERKLFRTPVGYAYLHDLQKRMAAKGVPVNEIPPVPLYQVFNNQIDEEMPVRNYNIPKRKKKDNVRKMNRTLVMVNIVLIIIIIALFYISLNAKNPNILNYRNVIQNEYSSWEQDLRDRENTIRQKERELNIVIGETDEQY